MIDFSLLKVQNVEDVITYPHIVDLSKLRFELLPIVLTTVYFLMSVVEGLGDATALCTDVLGRQPTTREITGTVVFDGFNSFLCCFFGALPLTTFAQNVGIVTQTKVTNRFTVFVGACFLVLTSFFPRCGKLFVHHSRLRVGWHNGDTVWFHCRCGHKNVQ